MTTGGNRYFHQALSRSTLMKLHSCKLCLHPGSDSDSAMVPPRHRKASRHRQSVHAHIDLGLSWAWSCRHSAISSSPPLLKTPHSPSSSRRTSQQLQAETSSTFMQLGTKKINSALKVKTFLIMLNKDEPNKRVDKSTRTVLHLPSFEHLMSISKDETHTEAAKLTHLHESKQGTAASPRGPSERVQDRNETASLFNRDPERVEAGPRRGIDCQSRSGEQERDREALFRRLESANNPYDYRHSARSPPGRQVCQGHKDSAEHDRARSIAKDEPSTIMGPPRVPRSFTSNGKPRRSVNAEYPTTRSSEDYRELFSRAASGVPRPSHVLILPSSKLRHTDDHSRRLPTQHIPSQEPRVGLIPRHHHREEERYRWQVERHMGTTPKCSPAQVEALPREYQTDLGRSFVAGREAVSRSSSNGDGPTRLPSQYEQRRIFDYSCARLPNERSSFPSARRLSSSEIDIVRVQPRLPFASSPEGSLEARHQRYFSTPLSEPYGDQMEYATQRQRANGPVYSDAFRSENYRLSTYSEDHARATDRQLDGRAVLTANARTSSSRPYGDKPSNSRQSSRWGDKDTLSSAEQRGHLSVSVDAGWNRRHNEGQCNGTCRASDDFGRDSAPSHMTAPHPGRWKEDVDEGMLRKQHSMREVDNSQEDRFVSSRDYHGRDYGERAAAIEQRAQREHQQLQTRCRSQSLLSSSRRVRAEYSKGATPPHLVPQEDRSLSLPSRSFEVGKEGNPSHTQNLLRPAQRSFETAQPHRQDEAWLSPGHSETGPSAYQRRYHDEAARLPNGGVRRYLETGRVLHSHREESLQDRAIQQSSTDL